MAPLDQAVLRQDQRAGPDEAHLALEDVDQLRQLVGRAAPQHPTDPGDPWIGGKLEVPARLVERLQGAALGLGAVDHAAELQDSEDLASG